MNKITKFFDGFGNIGELEEFTDGGPNVARLMSCGVSSWDGTIDGIRRPSINIPPDTLYDRKEGLTDECIAWLLEKGFKRP